MLRFVAQDKPLANEHSERNAVLVCADFESESEWLAKIDVVLTALFVRMLLVVYLLA